MKICAQCQSTYPDDYQVCPRDQQRLVAQVAEIRIGSILRGKYEILDKLGSGGMATVYKVKHLAFHQISALKVVHPEYLADPDFLKRFRNEAVVAWQLKHPNAVRIDDLDFTEEGRPFIVMEYIEGVSIYDARVRQPGPWPVDQCLTIVAQVAAALAAAHTLGIVHRDIKPSNILLTTGPDGHGLVKVLDFGIAKTSDRAFAGMTSVKTVSNMIIGTPEYMSPEQASGGQESSIDGRADLYSLGLVLYEMIVGSHPFRADTAMGMLVQQLHTEPANPHALQGGIPESVSALILKSLRKNPEDRFRSAAEMLQAVQDPDGWYRERNGLPRLKTSATSEVPILIPTTPVAAPRPVPAAAATPPPSAPPTPQPLTPPPFVPSPPSAPAASAPLAPPTPQPAFTNVPAPLPPAARPSPPQKKSGMGALIAIAAVLLLLVAGAGAWYFLGYPGYRASQNFDDAETAYAEKDYAKAASLFALTCPQGAVSPQPRACGRLGDMYAAGQGVPQDDAHAVTLYSAGCKATDGYSCFKLGSAYEKGRGIARDYTQAEKIYSQSCGPADVASCNALGTLYALGEGVRRDDSFAAKMYQKGCDQKDKGSCFQLARFYDQGRGVSMDGGTHAGQLYDQACKSGGTLACALLRYGKPGDHANDLRAANEFQRSCDTGNSAGCVFLGLMYRNAKGLPQDYAHAHTLFDKACQEADAQGCNELGVLFLNGLGQPASNAKALPLFAQSCDGGNTVGCANLGIVYQVGNGVPTDLTKARALFQKACAKGWQPACDRQKRLN